MARPGKKWKKLRALLIQGKTEDECLTELRIGPSEFENLLSQILEDEQKRLEKLSPGEFFVLHSLRMLGCLDQLDDVVSAGRADAKAGGRGSSKNLQAVVSAVRAKTQIWTEMNRLGQSLGVLPSGPQKEPTVDGKRVSSLELDDLRAAVRDKHAVIRTLIEEYGVGNYADEPDGPLYYDGKTAAIPSARPKRQKVH